MTINRRSVLLAAPALALLPKLARAEDDPRMAPRFVGSDAAPVTVTEWFSLTCPHCARFAGDTLPRIHTDLIDPGKLRYGYGDYPLDQVALTAAMIARSLPPARYEPFILALLAGQNRWAFVRGISDPDELHKKILGEIFKMAALAGMSRATFDATIADTKLRDAILAVQDTAQKTYHVDSTPTFIFDGPAQQGRNASGEMTYDAFATVVKEVGGSV
jgi:protein-disulfide isomerase